jgi:hypothetical protein
MNIGMMSAWNEDSGVSIHAELIGREWIKMGYKLKVFSFFPYDFHGTALVGKDEDYVVRCFTTSDSKNPYLDPRPLLETDFDIFVTQDLGMLPKDELRKIFHHIKRKASTVTIIHDNRPSSDPSFYQFDWDCIVYFDDRYKEFLKKYFPEEKLHMIPFPCSPLNLGSKKAAREKLGLPQDKKILLIFGHRLKEYLPVLPAIEEFITHFNSMLLVVSEKDLEVVRNIKNILIRRESPPTDRLYDYLHASDVLIIHRKLAEGALVSSTAYQCLGSGCPILASDTNYFETLKDVVITYSNLQEFRENLFDILHEGKRFLKARSALKEFINKNSAEIVAKKYIKLFHLLREERRVYIRDRTLVTTA